MSVSWILLWVILFNSLHNVQHISSVLQVTAGKGRPTQTVNEHLTLWAQSPRKTRSRIRLHISGLTQPLSLVFNRVHTPRPLLCNFKSPFKPISVNTLVRTWNIASLEDHIDWSFLNYSLTLLPAAPFSISQYETQGMLTSIWQLSTNLTRTGLFSYLTTTVSQMN